MEKKGPSRTAPSEAQIEAFIKEFFTSVPKRSRYEENVEPIQDSPYTDEFFRFENQKVILFCFLFYLKKNMKSSF